ncbi:hypothetical protein ColTof4_14350 [Colletotrichum tofieldiae]|nr:hypothetical protein ColTof3_14761 [Colletotrichum tofieldiae]GKT81927.1 hypothetical protein ColTof4_14350 [Colletotrichum tofieldiae]
MALGAPNMPNSIKKIDIKMEDFGLACAAVPGPRKEEIERRKTEAEDFNTFTRDYMYNGNKDVTDAHCYAYHHLLDAVIKVTEHSSFCQDSH